MPYLIAPVCAFFFFFAQPLRFGPTLTSAADPRLDALRTWLASLPPELNLALETLRPASSDASFRRYFRLDAAAGTLIVMDAPVAHEDSAPFVHVAGLLAAGGVNVPQILAKDLSQGFMLLTDLGQETFYQRIQRGIDDPTLQRLYRRAVGELVRMQSAAPTQLQTLDGDRLKAELALFPEWYVERHQGIALTDTQQNALADTFDLLARSSQREHAVLVHRDFHSPNLMVPEGDAADGAPGVIDFQDALAGPITYDIASLVMDARTTWEEPQQLDWAIRYWEAARAAGLPVDADFSDFHRAYEWMSLQRNLRILGVFARLNHRDGKSNYLAHMPRVNAYVRQVAERYNAFGPLRRILDVVDNRQVTSGFTF